MRGTIVTIAMLAGVLASATSGLYAAAKSPSAEPSYDHGRFSTYCHYLNGPLAGRYGDLRPHPPLPIGARCTDGKGNVGVAGWRLQTAAPTPTKTHKAKAPGFSEPREYQDGSGYQSSTAAPVSVAEPPPGQTPEPQPAVVATGSRLPPPPPTVGASPALPGEGTFGAGLLGTEFAGPNTYLGPPPTVTLFLKPYNSARNQAVCESFKTIPTAEQQRQSAKLLPNVLALRWILSQEVADFTDCKQLVGAYDFYRAGALLAGIVATTSHSDGTQADISGQGPFLVEQFSDTNGQHYVFVDFSKAADGDFKDLGPMVVAALATQADILRTGAASPTPGASGGGSGGNTSAAATDTKPVLTGFAKWACPFIENPIVKMIEAGLSLLPAGKIGVTVWDAGANPFCGVTPGQGATSGAATPAPASPKKK